MENPGFQTGNEVGRGTDLRGLEVPSAIAGWKLTVDEDHEVRWTTPSGYHLRIAGNRMAVKGRVPATDDDEEQIHMVKHEIVSTHADEGPQDALASAERWLENHPLPELETTGHTGIGDRIAEYLWFTYGIADDDDLRRALDARMLELSDFVQERYVEAIEDEL